MGCKRLTKWWYLQGPGRPCNGGSAVKGLQNGGIYKYISGEFEVTDAVKGLQNGGNYKGKFYATLL